jgi:hypothetical protein
VAFAFQGSKASSCSAVLAFVAAVEEGGALPLAAVLTSIDVKRVAQDIVGFSHGSIPSEAKGGHSHRHTISTLFQLI